jgi:hypothetical protein
VHTTDGSPATGQRDPVAGREPEHLKEHPQSAPGRYASTDRPGTPGDRAATASTRPKRDRRAQELICLVSWLLIASLRGLAASWTGMVSVSTPAV